MAVVSIAVALAGCTGDDDASSTSSTVPTDPSTPSSSAAPVLDPNAAPAADREPASTSASVAADLVTSSIELGQGVTVDGLTRVPTHVRRVDTLNHEPAERADFVAELTFDDGSVFRLTLGPDVTDTRPRQATNINGFEGWESDPSVGEIVASLGWKVGADTWIRLEVVGVDDEGGLDSLRTLATSIAYEPALDARVKPVAADPVEERLCGSAVAVAVAGGGPDMVLFTCDGVLAIYGGESGQRLEELLQFPEAVAKTAEGQLPAVTGLATSPDGATIYYSVGHDATSRVFRYTRGSGQPPVEVAAGWGPAVAPDGTIAVIGTGTGTELTLIGAASSRSVALYGMPVHSLAWSQDSTKLAFATHWGVVGVLDIATQDIQLFASTTPGQVYEEPWLEERGLTAFGQCCSGVPGEPIDFLVVGAPGNNVNLGSTGGDDVVSPLRRVTSTDRTVMTRLHGDRLGPPSQPWATGVIEATVLPTVSDAAVDLSGAFTD